MAKEKKVFSCNECNGQSSKWVGQCPHCHEWNTLVESVAETISDGKNRFTGIASNGKLQLLSEVESSDVTRISTGNSEFDRVLGGGLVKDSVVLISGEPGVGKSTILLQVLSHLSKNHCVVYVTGEESGAQISSRAKRLSLNTNKLYILPEIQFEKIHEVFRQKNPSFVVIDSIQTVYTDTLTSAPGSITQVRECASMLARIAKSNNFSLLICGHVNKTGEAAGPNTLMHIVDCTLEFSGESNSSYRLIRATKNRFGNVNEVGIFGMTDTGLREVSNPSAMFLSQYGSQVAGACVTVTQEGTRPLLVEIQALLDESRMPSPRRLALGLDGSRLSMLMAVLHRHTGIATFSFDSYINVVGGIKLIEPGSDLPTLLAIVSSLRDKPVPQKAFAFGEVGLNGEIRPVQRGQERINEALRHGFTRAIVPKANAPRKKIPGIDIFAVERLNEAIAAIK